MKKIRFFFTVLSVFCAVLAYGQDMITVSGTVTDASNGEPVPFASIQLKGTMTGANTDGDGNFSMDVPPDEPPVLSSSHTVCIFAE